MRRQSVRGKLDSPLRLAHAHSQIRLLSRLSPAAAPASPALILLLLPPPLLLLMPIFFSFERMKEREREREREREGGTSRFPLSPLCCRCDADRSVTVRLSLSLCLFSLHNCFHSSGFKCANLVLSISRSLTRSFDAASLALLPPGLSLSPCLSVCVYSYCASESLSAPPAPVLMLLTEREGRERREAMSTCTQGCHDSHDSEGKKLLSIDRLSCPSPLTYTASRHDLLFFVSSSRATVCARE